MFYLVTYLSRFLVISLVATMSLLDCLSIYPSIFLSYYLKCLVHSINVVLTNALASRSVFLYIYISIYYLECLPHSIKVALTEALVTLSFYLNIYLSVCLSVYLFIYYLECLAHSMNVALTEALATLSQSRVT